MASVRQIRSVYFTLEFLNWFALALPLPVFVLLMQARGMSLLQIGWLSGLYSLCIVLLELPTGGLADAIGRKPVAVLSCVASLLASVLFLFSFSFWWFAAAWILLGVSRALASGALSAWFVDSLLHVNRDTDLQPHLAHANMFVILGLSLGTLLGGLLPQLFAYLPQDGLAILTPLATTLVAATAVKVINIGVLLRLVTEQRPLDISGKIGVHHVPAIIKDAIVASKDNPVIVLLFIASCCSVLVLTGIETFWQPHFKQWLGTSQNSFLYGLLLTGAFVMGILGNLLTIPLSRMLRKRYGLVAAIFQGFAGLAVILLSFQQQVGFAIGFFWLYYCLNAGLESPTSTILNQLIPSSRRSSMQSVLSLGSYLGAFIGSVSLGWLSEYRSIALAWMVAGGLLTVSATLFVFAERLRAARSLPVKEEIEPSTV